MKPIVCYVTDRKSGNVPTQIRAAAAAGVDWVQIREKDMCARDLLALARGAIEATGGEARIIVNDRLDVALAAGAAGVHLGGESVPVREVVRWCRSGNAPAGFLVGVSCHDLDQARDAESAGASYVFFGPVFDSPAKRAFGPPQGVARLAEACRAVRIPVIAIGGVNEENGADCIRAGAAGIAAIRLFQEPREPAALKEAVARMHELVA
ncbi:MAG: thiamine phosphate synthase [Candidatus Acidiferrales bacterium]|jgi:thiamine-phosphate pyrophosphorylase